MDQGLVTGLAAFRWLAWTWMAVVLVVSREQLDDAGNHPVVALALVGLAFLFTAGATVAARTRPKVMLAPPAVALELAIGAALIIADRLAFSPLTQTLGSAWPVAGVLSAGIVLGARAGVAGGLTLGLAELVGAAASNDGQWAEARGLAVVSTTVLYAVAGGAAGYTARRAREAEREVSEARAREGVARHLHDGVLQTLAVVQRRTDDADLARLAHEQERDLRAFLAGDLQGDGDDLGAALRRAAARFEDNHGGRVQVIVADDLPPLTEASCSALAGAVGEALTNAGKHGGAGHVTIYAEPADDGGVFCSVNDDGAGFVPDHVVEGVGLPRSIRGRITEVGGRVEVDSAPGRGTEIKMWVP